jgi:hypothetical protein
MMMKLADLSQETLEKIKTVRWDRIIEKHEGPEDWESVLRWYEPEFLSIDDRPVLLPVERDHHPNITILRSIWSADGNVLTLFLKDTTHYGDDPFSAGFMAVCEKVAGEAFFLATVYHEWFIIERSAILEA